MLNLQYCNPATFDDALTKCLHEMKPDRDYERFALAIWRAAIESAIGVLQNPERGESVIGRLTILRDAMRP